MLKKVLINVFVILTLILFFEMICFGIYNEKNKSMLDLQKQADLDTKIRYYLPTDYLGKYFTDGFTNYVNKNNTKRPILILGCSYARGVGIDGEKGLDFLLFQKTHRDVFKRAFAGGGIQLALDLFQTDYIQKQVPDAEYIIYVFINYHLERLYEYQLDYLSTEVNQRYELTNDGQLKKIKRMKFPLYYSLFSVKLLQKQIASHKYKNEHKDYKLFNAVLNELKNETQKAYKNSKFVVLLYPSSGQIDNNDATMEDYEIQKLKDEGFIVLDAEKLTDKHIRGLDFRLPDQDHPDIKAWQAIVPSLIRELNL